MSENASVDVSSTAPAHGIWNAVCAHEASTQSDRGTWSDHGASSDDGISNEIAIENETQTPDGTTPDLEENSSEIVSGLYQRSQIGVDPDAPVSSSDPPTH